MDQDGLKERNQPDVATRSRVVLHRKPRIETYELTAQELELLAKGSQQGLWERVGWALISSGVAAGLALLTGTPASRAIECFFLALTSSNLAAGVALVSLTGSARRSATRLLDEILHHRDEGADNDWAADDCTGDREQPDPNGSQ